MKNEIIRARVNIKSLMAEAKIIRQEIKKVNSEQKSMLHEHLVNKVRPEARLAFLALAFLKKKNRSITEKTTKKVNVEKLVRKINIYRGYWDGTYKPISKEQVIEWLST